MKVITQITKKEVLHIISLLAVQFPLLDVKFLSFKTYHYSPKPPCVGIEIETNECHTLSNHIVIVETGLVVWSYSDWIENKEHIKAVNALPIIDYLKSEGFEFKY